jgi:hypothetical protein
MAFSPVRVNFPDSSRVFQKSPEERAYIENVVRTTRQELEVRTRDDSARTALLLQAADNSVWALSVGTDGAVTTTKVR